MKRPQMRGGLRSRAGYLCLAIVLSVFLLSLTSIYQYFLRSSHHVLINEEEVSVRLVMVACHIIRQAATARSPEPSLRHMSGFLIGRT